MSLTNGNQNLIADIRSTANNLTSQVNNQIINGINNDAIRVGDKLYANVPAPINPVIQPIIDNINTTTQQLEKTKKQIEDEDREILNKMNLTEQQREEIAYKKRLLLTRDRMLELTYEKNIYKKKIIYTLLALIIFIIILMLFTYSYFRRGGVMNAVANARF